MELDASENERRQLAYSTQFFDFTPDAFIDSITGQSVDIINEHLEVRLVNIEHSGIWAAEKCSQIF